MPLYAVVFVCVRPFFIAPTEKGPPCRYLVTAPDTVLCASVCVMSPALGCMWRCAPCHRQRASERYPAQVLTAAAQLLTAVSKQLSTPVLLVRSLPHTASALLAYAPSAAAAPTEGHEGKGRDQTKQGATHGPKGEGSKAAPKGACK